MLSEIDLDDLSPEMDDLIYECPSWPDWTCPCCGRDCWFDETEVCEKCRRDICPACQVEIEGSAENGLVWCVDCAKKNEQEQTI